MEHINGAWIPVGILGMFFVAGVIDLIRTPKANNSYRDSTANRVDYTSATRPA